MPFPQPTRDPVNVLSYYLLDAASVLAVEALNVQPSDDILDMCAGNIPSLGPSVFGASAYLSAKQHLAARVLPFSNDSI